MALNIRDLGRMSEFSLELKSLGTVRCLSLKTPHFLQANKRLRDFGDQSIDLVRWLFGEIARRPVDRRSDEGDAVEGPSLAEEELGSVTAGELEEFADKLIQKNRYLLKTHEEGDIERSIDESACDFLVRAFRHHAAEQKAQWERMTQSVSKSLVTGATVEAMQLGLAQQSALGTIAQANRYATENSACLTSAMHFKREQDLMRAAISPYQDAQRFLEESSVSAMLAKANYGNEDVVRAAARALSERQTMSAVIAAGLEKQHYLTAFSSSTMEEARKIAELAQAHALHASLDPYKTSVESLANKLLHLQTLDAIGSPAYLDAFMQASTISDIFIGSMRVDHRLQDATWQFSKAAVPIFSTLNDYRNFLDAAGLRLGRWPHPRLLSSGEKRRRLRSKLKNNAEPKHVKKAKSLVHQYELTLRDILDEAMAAGYGEDWAERRLPLCGCKDLLGRWERRGGEVLAHADYAHYERIMSNPEHFEAVFESGFEDPAALAELMKKAGELRAALLHCHPFSSEDLRDLRLTWRTIETGLLALTADFELEGYD